MRAGLILTGVFLMVLGFFLIFALIGIPIGFAGFVIFLYGIFSSGKKEVVVPVYGQPAQQNVVINPQPQQSPGSQAGTKFCQFCGSPMSKAGSFCPSCGKGQL